MSERLQPCGACRRHVAIGAPSCPFCGAARPRLPQAGLSRAAILASATLATAGCGGKPKPDPNPDPPMQAADGGISADAAAAITPADAGAVVPADAGAVIPADAGEDEAARRERERLERDRQLRERRRRDDRLKMPYGAPQARRRVV